MYFDNIKIPFKLLLQHETNVTVSSIHAVIVVRNIPENIHVIPGTVIQRLL